MLKTLLMRIAVLVPVAGVGLFGLALQGVIGFVLVIGALLVIGLLGLAGWFEWRGRRWRRWREAWAPERFPWHAKDGHVSHLVLFLDDGGVMNDNSLRGPQWQRLVGEFFPPILGGTLAAWAEANRAIVDQRTVDFWQPDSPLRFPDYASFHRAEFLTWLQRMCALVGVPAPPEAESLELVGHLSRIWPLLKDE